MIYRCPGFLVDVWFGSSPTPFPLSLQASCLFSSAFLCVAGRAYLGESCRGKWGGGGAKSHDPWGSPVIYKSFNTLWLWISLKMCPKHIYFRKLDYLRLWAQRGHDNGTPNPTVKLKRCRSHWPLLQKLHIKGGGGGERPVKNFFIMPDPL